MNNSSQISLATFLPVFFIIALWDAFTTVFGTIAILGGAEVGSVITGIVVAVLMLILFVMTFQIWGNYSHNQNEFMIIILRGLWIIAICYDIFTSFYGNREFIVSGDRSTASVVVILMATILVSGSTIVASWIISEN